MEKSSQKTGLPEHRAAPLLPEPELVPPAEVDASEAEILPLDAPEVAPDDEVEAEVEREPPDDVEDEFGEVVAVEELEREPEPPDADEAAKLATLDEVALAEPEAPHPAATATTASQTSWEPLFERGEIMARSKRPRDPSSHALGVGVPGGSRWLPAGSNLANRGNPPLRIIQAHAQLHVPGGAERLVGGDYELSALGTERVPAELAVRDPQEVGAQDHEVRLSEDELA